MGRFNGGVIKKSALVVHMPGYGERVGKLYLPPGATRFASRRAHDLTYTSCQESGRDKRFRSKMAKLLGRSESTVPGPMRRSGPTDVPPA
jgi:hypothetical protein